MKLLKRLFGFESASSHASATRVKAAGNALPVATSAPTPPTSVSTRNLSPGDEAPVSGTYSCDFCCSADSSIEGALAGYAKSKGLNSRDFASVLASAGMDGKRQVRTFSKGQKLGGCPKCGDAASWSLK